MKQKLHSLFCHYGVTEATIVSSKGIFHYLFLSPTEFQFWSEGNMPTNYTVE